jgi:hypothetical protein
VSAVTSIDSPLTDGSALIAEAIAAVVPPITDGTRTPGMTALVTPTATVVAAPVIRLDFIFGKLHPAILSVQANISQG